MIKKKWLAAGILLILGMAGIIRCGLPVLEEWKESHSGIPDAVSSMSSNNWQYLKVVANSDRIDDKETFAREVVQMCRENSFHSVFYGYKRVSERGRYHSLFKPEGFGKGRVGL